MADIQVVHHKNILEPGKEISLVSADKTCLEILAETIPDSRLWPFAHIQINDWTVPQEQWEWVKPKNGTFVSISIVPHGGGENNDGLRTLAFLALAVGVSMIDPTGYTATQVAMMRIGALYAGSVLINEYLPPTQPEQDTLNEDDLDRSQSIGIQGARNRLRPWGVVPRVLGRHRMTPPYGAQPYTIVKGNDQYLRCLFLWGYGPLEIDDLKIGETPISTFDQELVEYTFPGTKTEVEFTDGDISSGGEAIDVTDHGLDEKSLGLSSPISVKLTTTGTLPSPLSTDKVYLVVQGLANSFKLADFRTKEVISLTADGSGTHTIAPHIPFFSNDTTEESLSITLEQADSWQTRTTEADTDEIIVDITFPSGLYHIESDGSRSSRSVTVEAEFRSVESGSTFSVGSGGVAFNSRNVDLGLELRDKYTVEDSTTDGGSSQIRKRFTRAQYVRVVLDKFTGAIGLIYGNVATGSGSNDAVTATKPAVPSRYYLLAAVHRTSVLHPTETSIEDERSASDPYDKADGDFLVSDNTISSHTTILGSPADYERITVASGSLEYGGVQTTSRSNETIRRSIHLVPEEKGQFDVRLRRITAEGGSRDVDEVRWTALRSVSHTDPVQRHDLAATVIEVKATDQLNGVIDEFNGIVTSILPYYDADNDEWVEEPTSNPAAIFREVLQGEANKRAVADSLLDLSTLETWSQECDDDAREFNQVIDFQTTVGELLRNIASAGRASPHIIDGEWSVVRDVDQSTPVQHFSPRNSWGFSAQRTFQPPPHALRVRFPNEDQGYQQDETLIYDDGFDSTNATRIVRAEYPGLTRHGQVWMRARYDIANHRLRPEVYEWNADIENIVCTRGDLVKFTHDVPLFGQIAARVKSFDFSSGDIATSVTLDEEVSMESGSNYALRFRAADGTSVLKDVDTNNGSTTDLTFTTPFDLSDSGLAVGDLVLFGEKNSESIDLVIRSIEPMDELSARITAVDDSPGVRKAGQEAEEFISNDVDTGADTITISGNTFVEDDLVGFSTTGSLPGGLEELTASGNPAYFIVTTGDDIQVSETEGGSAVDLTSGGSGTHSVFHLIPSFDSQISEPIRTKSRIAPGVTPTVDDIRSDGQALHRALDGSLQAQILISIEKEVGLRDDITTIETQFRESNDATGWKRLLSDIGETPIAIRDVETGLSYDLRLRYATRFGAVGDWLTPDDSPHEVVGKTGAPGDVTDFRVQQNGETVTMQWSDNPDLDVAGYEVRYSRTTVQWEDARVLPRRLRSTRITEAAVPPSPKPEGGTRLPWRFRIKAVDTSGNYSENAAVFDLVVSPSFDAIFQEEQAPAWLGQRTDCIRNPLTGFLEPLSSDSDSTSDEVFDTAIPNPLAYEYEAPEIDISFDDDSRIWFEYDGFAPPSSSAIILPIAELDFRLEDGSYDGFEEWEVGQATARFYKMKVSLGNTDGAIISRQFTPVVDLLEHEETVDITIPVGGLEITFQKAYRELPDIEVNLDNENPVFFGKTLTGFKVWALDDSGTDVGDTGSYTAIGV